MDKNKNSHSDKVGEGVNFPLTEDVNQILDALVERYSTVSRSMLQYEPDKTLVELKKFSIEACPYYEFDVQKFYAAPSPAQSWNVYHYLKIKRVYWENGRMEQLFY
ncbi:MAG: hypothetical protein ACLU4N_05875 [Butyricimonas faecihominis]